MLYTHRRYFANVCNVLHVLLTLPFLCRQEAEEPFFANSVTRCQPGFRERENWCFWSLQTLGLLVISRKGQFERASFSIYIHIQSRLKTFYRSSSLLYRLERKGNEQLATPVHVLTYKAYKATRSASKTVQKLCKAWLFSKLFFQCFANRQADLWRRCLGHHATSHLRMGAIDQMQGQS